uniref:RxLR effector candidate protein n=1 Tax=Hyaloperonospora arabidopsidis (strain Emoy2) TaxID=559515 RepID=M4BR33_HYAAE
MKVVSTVAVATAALLKASGATDIDAGFAQDGATTYCMGVNGPVGALTFDLLEGTSAGRCPVGVTLTFPSSEFHVNEPLTVKWAAKAQANVANSIFPNAIDPVTKLPGAVTTSALFACTAGTNCATNVGGTSTGADGTRAGPFAPDGLLALETNTFTLSAASDYVIVGLVALPGDPSLNIAATEYVVFKKISVVEATSSSSTSNSGSVATSALGSDSASGSTGSSSTSPPVATSPPLTSAPSSSLGVSNVTSPATNRSLNTTSSDDEVSKKGLQSDLHGHQETDSGTKKTTESPNSGGPNEGANQTGDKETEPSGLTESASTSKGGGVFGKSGIAIIGVIVGICIAVLAGFIFMIRRRKQQRANANKAFDLDSPCVVSEMNDSVPNSKTGGNIDLTYVANVSARNTDSKANDNMMSDNVAAFENGSKASSIADGSMHSLPKSSLDTDKYSEDIRYGIAGSAGHPNEAEIDAYRMSNTSGVSSYVSVARSDASMSHFGDSLVSASQKKYLQPGDWNDSMSSQMDSRLQSTEQAETMTRGVGGIGGSSMTSMSSVDNASSATGSREHDSMVGSHFNDELRSTTGYRETEDSRASEDSRATGFLEAMGESRLQSEVSVDSYGFRASCSSTDSYSSGMSSYSRGSSRISGCSVDSNLDSSNSFSKY